MAAATELTPGWRQPGSGEARVLRELISLTLADQWDRRAADELAGTYPAQLAYFVLDTGHQTTIEHFLEHTLGRIIAQMSRRTERKHQEYRGRVRGRISWPHTIKNRLTAAYDPTCFVCQEVSRQYDTPENQLVRFLVESVADCIRQVPAVLRHGWCCEASTQSRSGASISARIRHMQGLLAKLKRHPRLRSVTLPAEVTPEHLRCAENAHLIEYRHALELHQRADMAVSKPSSELVHDASRRVLLLPARADADGQPWIQLAATLLRPMESANG